MAETVKWENDEQVNIPQKPEPFDQQPARNFALGLGPEARSSPVDASSLPANSASVVSSAPSPGSLHFATLNSAHSDRLLNANNPVSAKIQEGESENIQVGDGGNIQVGDGRNIQVGDDKNIQLNIQLNDDRNIQVGDRGNIQVGDSNSPRDINFVENDGIATAVTDPLFNPVPSLQPDSSELYPDPVHKQDISLSFVNQESPLHYNKSAVGHQSVFGFLSFLGVGICQAKSVSSTCVHD